MPRPLCLLSLTALGLFVFSDSVRAQAVGVGGSRPFGVYGTVWPGYYGAYSSSWSNVFSLYGPPVPTYGSVPGAFGGADQRLSNFNYNFSNINIENGAGIGLGAPGSGGAGPRRRHWAGNDAGVPQSQAATGQANIDVRVPAADAEVLFEGTNTRQAGVRRLFQSPVLQVGTTYYYKIRARWKQQDGTVTEQERSVGVRANETTAVDFTAPTKVDDKRPLLAAP
jgi:uncharacterized protein (TIGR03000 family)